MASFATIDDVIADWGEIGTTGEESQVETWIASLSNRLRLIGRKRGQDVDALVVSDPLAKEGAKDAVVAAVRRRLQNPEGFRQLSESETTGPLSESRSGTLDSTIAGGGMNFLEDDLLWLPTAKKSRIQSFGVKSGYYQ